APRLGTVACTIGMSMFGNLVIGRARKLKMPKITSTTKVTLAGIGLRIDQAEMLSLIARLPRPFFGPHQPKRSGARDPLNAGMPQPSPRRSRPRRGRRELP